MLQRPDVKSEAKSSDALLLRASKLDILERLSDDLAHEIKNPLHSMVINLEVLKRRIARWGEDEQSDVLRYVGVLGTELERVSRRIDLLLRLARPVRGPEHTTLDEMVGELLEVLQLEGRRQRVEVYFEPSTATARLHLQREPVRHVILNLVLGAVDRLEPGCALRLRTASADGRAALVLSATDEAGEAVPLGDHVDPAAEERLLVARVVAERVGGRIEPDPENPPGVGEGSGCLVFSLPVAGG